MITSFTFKISGVAAYTDGTSGPFESTYSNGIISSPFESESNINFSQLYTDESDVVDSLQDLLTLGSPDGKYLKFIVSAPVQDKTISDWWMDINGIVTYDDETSGYYCVQYRNGSFNDLDGKVNFYALLADPVASGAITDALQSVSSVSEVGTLNLAPTDITLSSASIAENNEIGAVIGTFSTVDPDAGNSFTYTLVAGTGDTNNVSFTILGSSLKANAVFNFESKNSYTVRVRSTNQGGLTTEKAFTITVADVAENQAPTDILLSAATIAENSAIGAVIGTFSTVDPDAGDSFTYSLASGTGDTNNASFTIDGSSLKANAAFNFEVKSSYSVRIRSTDQGGLTFEKAFTITVTNANETPTDIALSVATIAENNAIGAVIGTFSTTDPDAGNTFTYSLVSGTGDTNNASFTILGSSLKASAVFNFEVKNSYTVRVRSTDQGGLTTEKAFAITVTNVNETPTDITLSAATIAENNAIGDAIGTLSTTDPDAENTFTYSLVAGTGDTDNASFTIDGASLKAAAAFDYETKNSYSVRIRSTDQGGLYYEKALTITVTDVNEQPTLVTLSANTIAENNEIGAVIGTFTTTDPDAGNTFTYTLTETINGTEVDNASFSIDGSNLIANVVFDYEVKSTYYIHVRSTDQGGLYGGDVPGSPPYPDIGWRFTITVTDEVAENSAPTDISLSADTIAENNEIGDVIGTLSTTDPDAENTFTYSLVSGEGDTDNASFSIDGSGLIANEVFDYEVKSSYSVRIRSTDQGELYYEKPFTITVTDVIENQAPTDISLSSDTIAENNELFAVIGTLSTTDPDAGDTFTYSLVSGEGSDNNFLFAISGSDLRADHYNPFDYEANSSYSVRIRSTDQGGLWTEKAFTITVTDVDENQAPTDITINNEIISVNNEIGETIGYFYTTDPDNAGPNDFTYSLVSGAGDGDNDSFSINNNPIFGSSIRAEVAAMSEQKGYWFVRVRSTDPGGLYYERSFTLRIDGVDPL